MTPKEPKTTAHQAHRIRLLDGLSDLEQAAIAREYESRTGRAFRCRPCQDAGRLHPIRVEADADEPAYEVVAVVEAPEGLTPICESCYRRLTDSTRGL